MRVKIIVLAAAVLLAFGASGAVATSITNSQSAPVGTTPADTTQSTNYTGDVVDPDDKLSPANIEDAREIAWANDDVNDRFAGDEPAYLEVRAPSNDDDDVSVWIAENETASMELVVNVDLDKDTVMTIEEVRTADKAQKIDLNATSVMIADDDSETDFEWDGNTDDTGNDDPIRITADEMMVTNLNETEYTVSEASESES